MSSFICTPKHFNSVGSYVAYTLPNNSSLKYGKAFKLIGWVYGINSDIIEQRVFEIFETLKELNVLCVSLQYKHHYEGVLDAQISSNIKALKVKTKVEILNPVSCYKLVNCINYQIETRHLIELRGLTPEEETALKFLRLLADDLAHYITSDLLAYNEAKWSID
jgi:hypothetical protein